MTGIHFTEFILILLDINKGDLKTIMNTYLSIANNTVTINNIYKSKCKDRIISEIIDALLLDSDPIFIELFKEDGVNIMKRFRKGQKKCERI